MRSILFTVVFLAGCNLQARIDAVKQDIGRTVMDPYHRWELSSPIDCASKDLLDSIRLARAVAANFNDLEMRQRSATYQLDIADGALRKSCIDFADVVYRDVIKIYTGLGYAAHRQRAEIGLADVREARRRVSNL